MDYETLIRWEADDLEAAGFGNLAWAETRRKLHQDLAYLVAGNGTDREAHRTYGHGVTTTLDLLAELNDQLADPVTEPRIADPHVDKIEFEAKRGVKRVRFGRVSEEDVSKGWWVEVLELSDPTLQEWTSVFSASLLDVEDVRWILGVQIGADYGTLLTDVVN